MLESENRTIRHFYFVHEQGFIRRVYKVSSVAVCRKLDSPYTLGLILVPLAPLHSHTHTLRTPPSTTWISAIEIATTQLINTSKRL